MSFQDEWDSDTWAMQRARNARDKQYWEDQERRDQKNQREWNREYERRRHAREIEYFTACAKSILDCLKPQWKADTLRTVPEHELAEALKFIYDSGIKSQWFNERLDRARNAIRLHGDGILSSQDVFRKAFFEPFLVENLKGCVDTLVEEWGRGKENSRSYGKPFNSAYYTYRCAVFNVMSFLDEKRTDAEMGALREQRHRVHDELRGFKQNPQRKHPAVYPLAEDMILSVVKDHVPAHRYINTRLTKISGPRWELWYADRITIENTRSMRPAVTETGSTRKTPLPLPG